MDPQTSTSRSRPAGGVESMLPASAPAGGVRRSSRVRSNVDPALPATGGSRKAPIVEEKPASKVRARRGSGSAARRGSQESQVVEQWGLRGPRESAATYGSRISAKLAEYEQLGKRLKGLREDLKFARHRVSTASKKQKPGLSARVKSLQQEIKDLELQRMTILEGSDVFREKLVNEDRFARMKSPKKENDESDCSADEESSSDDEQDMEAEAADVSVAASGEAMEAVSQPVQSVQSVNTSQASIPAAQVALPLSGESAGEEEDGTGALMAQIVNMESPVHMDNFSFGDDLGEEKIVKKKKKRQRKSSQQVNLVYESFVPSEPAAKSVQGADPGNLPVPASANVERGQSTGKTTVKMAESANLACQGSEAGASVGTAKGPDNVAGKVACLQPGGFGAVGHSSAGEGGSVQEPRAGAELGRPGSSGDKGGGSHSGSGIARRSSAGKGGSVQASGATFSAAPSVVSGSAELWHCGGAVGGGAKCKDGNVGASVSQENTSAGDRLVQQEHEHDTCADNTNLAMLLAVQEIEAGVLAEAEGKHSGKVASSQILKGGTAAQSQEPKDARDASVIASSSRNIIKPARLHPGQSRIARQGEITSNVVSNDGSNAANVIPASVSVGGGGGPAAPPAVAAPSRSYANVAAGGPGGSSSLNPGEGNLQRRLLEALRKGDRTLQVEGREVDLSFYIERHGLGAFREHNGEVVWSLPTPGQEVGRRNVVRLIWRGSDACPSRAKVVELLFQMRFRANDIFALIHPYGTSEFDISFVKPEGLELFWSNHELVKDEPVWRDFAVKAVSRQSSVKKVTVLTRNESLSCYDIMTWLGRFGEVMDVPKKNLDEHGIWSGAWTFSVRLRRSGNTVTHIPSAAFLGRDRIQVFYQGQPKLCHRCGDPTHFSANCTKQVCALCGAEGHLAASCGRIRCNLCGDLGHPFSRCPRSFSNAAATRDRESREVASPGEGTSRGEGAPGPVKKVKNKSPSKLMREEKRRRSRDLGSSLVAGVVDGSAPGAGSEKTAEALGDAELDEEVRRLRKEEAKRTISSSSSQYESLDEDGGKWQDEKPKCGKRRQGQGKSGASSKSSSSVTGQVSKEDPTKPPLIVLSNRYQTLDGGGLELEPEELPGGAEPAPPEAVSSGGQVAPGSGDEDLGMDLSTSLKRNKEKSKGSSSDGEGGKKKGKK